METTSSKNQFNKSFILVRANALHTQKNIPMKEALKQAWAVARLTAALRTQEVVEFAYKTVSGKIRKARGTLKLNNWTPVGSGNRKPVVMAQAYWDLDRKAFRSFSIGNLIVA